MRCPVTALVAVLSLAVATAARAEPDPPDPPARRRRIAHSAAVLAGGGLWIVSETALKDRLEADRCRWCDPPGLDDGTRGALVWDEGDRDRAATLSNVTGFVLAPVAGLGILWAASWERRRVGRWLDDALPVLETVIAQGLLNQVVKAAVGRQRPFVHHADPSRPGEPDDNMSFYSGHTSLTFSIATSAATVARLRGYDDEPVLLLVGVSLAATTGYLRIAADKHYLTDVVTGALLGSAIGLGLPRLLHGRLADEHRLTVVPSAGGAGIAGVF